MLDVNSWSIDNVCNIVSNSLIEDSLILIGMYLVVYIVSIDVL